MRMALLSRSAEKLGIVPNALFSKAADLAGRAAFQEEMRGFPSRLPEDRDYCLGVVISGSPVSIACASSTTHARNITTCPSVFYSVQNTHPQKGHQALLGESFVALSHFRKSSPTGVIRISSPTASTKPRSFIKPSQPENPYPV